MHSRFRDHLRNALTRVVFSLEGKARNATRPCPSLFFGAIADRFRSPAELAAENQLLRQEVILLVRQITKPQLTPRDRVRLVLLARRTKTWAKVLPRTGFYVCGRRSRVKPVSIARCSVKQNNFTRDLLIRLRTL